MLSQKIINKESFHLLYQGKQIELFTLSNQNDITIQITNYGAKIVSIFVPDREGKLKDVVLGYDNIKDYIAGNPYFGAICGRYANRIAKGKFTIGDIEYKLPINNGPNHLHGGPEGFNNKCFDMVEYSESSKILELSYLSRDSEMNYPGNLRLNVHYELTDANELIINYSCTTDKPTHVNICAHSFFNLAGEGNGDILNHELFINADKYTPVDENQIPTGELASVENSPFDFRKPKKIGKDINVKNFQLETGKGYDHNFVIKDSGMSLAAKCVEPQSGRCLEVFTTQPGVQLYTGNWLDGSDKGKNGHCYDMRSAFCIETQHFPDSPNKPSFPSTQLLPGEKYNYICKYKFSVQK